MSQPAPYTAKDVAFLLGCSIAVLRRHYRTFVARDGMPRTIVEGRYTWERSGIDAWIVRHHPARAGVAYPSNDAAPLPGPQTPSQWRDYLGACYGVKGQARPHR